MNGKTIYVMSDNRSGSTLLDQLLGAHDQIVSLGEVHHLVAYFLEDRSRYDPVHPLVCSCGEPVSGCPFWSNVLSHLEQPPEALTLRLRFFDKHDRSSRLGQVLRRNLRELSGRRPRLLLQPLLGRLLNAPDVATDSFALYDAILRETRAKYLVDSSKDALRFRILYENDPDRIVGILLVRDYRGTIHSKMKRGRSLRESAIGWARHMNMMTELTRDIPSERLVRVKFEDLCHDPKGELQRLCRFLDIEFSETMLTRPSSGIHHIGGSPSKFDPAQREIALDESYIEAFDARELEVMRNIVGEIAGEWGYD